MMKWIMNRKFLGFLFCCAILPVMVILGYILFTLFFSFLFYLKHDEFIFDWQHFKHFCSVIVWTAPLGIGIWYLECCRLNIHIPFINDNKYTRWIEAANHITEDVNKKVLCPECKKVYLDIALSVDDEQKELRHMSCSSCGAYQVIRIKS